MILRRKTSPDGAVSALTDLLSWLHDLGDLDHLGVFEVAPGRAVFALGSGVPIPPGTGATLFMRPQRDPVRPTQLVVPEAIAGQFLIADVRVGNRSQLQTPDPLPASAFTPTSLAGHRGKISFETVQTAMDFAIDVHHVGDRACAFLALVFCQVESWLGPSRIRDEIASISQSSRLGLGMGMLNIRGELSSEQASEIMERARSAVASARADAVAGSTDAYPSVDSPTDPIIDESKP